MRPTPWQPPVIPSGAEQAIIKRIRRAKLFVFLREARHELFSEVFQAELAALYQDSVLGQPPISPAQLALATILQAYTGVSDDEVIGSHHHGPVVATSPGLPRLHRVTWGQRSAGGHPLKRLKTPRRFRLTGEDLVPWITASVLRA